MSRINNPMEVYKLLNGSNCQDCREKTCLAFAVAVFKGRKPIHACPHLPQEITDRFGGRIETADTIDENKAAAVKQLQAEIPGIDLSAAAKRTGGDFTGNQLNLPVFGKRFTVERSGALSSEVHINAWIAVPVLNYILHSTGTPPTGDWITFREIEGGPPRYAHFQQCCEKPLKQVADSYPDLFADMLELFDGKKVSGTIDSDVAIVLHPLPLFPIQVNYWYPEDGLESSLHISFDASADKNLDIESIYTMSEGIALMFKKIARRHGVQ